MFDARLEIGYSIYGWVVYVCFYVFVEQNNYNNNNNNRCGLKHNFLWCLMSRTIGIGNKIILEQLVFTMYNLLLYYLICID